MQAISHMHSNVAWKELFKNCNIDVLYSSIVEAHSLTLIYTEDYNVDV